MVCLAIVFVNIPGLIFVHEYSITCDNGSKYVFDNYSHMKENVSICEDKTQIYLNNDDMDFTNGIRNYTNFCEGNPRCAD